jgi:hypothetical protein
MPPESHEGHSEEQAISLFANDNSITNNNNNDESSRYPQDLNDNDNDIAPALQELSSPILPIPTPSTAPSAFTRSSLAAASTTPWLARILIPLLCIGTHALFYYGQTAPMWKLRLFSHIDVWANATNYTSRRAFQAVGLDYHIPFQYDKDEDVETFTYWFAIQQLWRARKMPSVVLPRIAAILLVMFSGIWPHIKLFMLNVSWLLPAPPQSRTRLLHWLSCFGKWSLADVLTVCVMVGVLHLDWNVDPDAIKDGVISELPAILAIVKNVTTTETLCDQLLKMQCHKEKRVDKMIKCKGCQTFVEEAFNHPNWARSTGRSIVKGVDTSGGGLATLRVVGMGGIYAFCAAVILSILLSVVVDIYDHKYKRALAVNRVSHTNNNTTTAYEDNDDDDDDDQQEQYGFLCEPLLSSIGRSNAGNIEALEVDSGDELFFPRRQRFVRLSGIFGWKYFLASVASVLLVVFAVDLATMERVVTGAGPKMLHDILQVNFQREYSLRSLMWVTGAAGGWDYLLMGTFSLFCVFGPVFRAVLLVAISFMDKSDLLRPMVGPVATLVNLVGAFCAWEVFVIAILMVDMLMPSITNTIIDNPACGQISDDGSCLQVEFNILQNNFSLITIGGILLLSTAWVAVSKGAKEDILDTPIVSDASGPNQEYQRIAPHAAPRDDDDNNALEELVFETNDV